MAIHEYACPKCGKEYEQREPMDSPRTQYCITMCGGLAKRVMSVPSIGRSNNGNSYTPFNQSENSPCPIPEGVIKKVSEVREKSGANYIAAGQLIKDKLWAITTVPDNVGEQIVKIHQKIKAAPYN